MRIFKMLALILIGSHLTTRTQEEPIVNSDEFVEQEAVEQTTDVPEENYEEYQEEVMPEDSETIANFDNQAMEEASAAPQAIEIPAVPEPTIEDASEIVEETSSQSPMGIDTVSLEDPQGNWLFKRIWWERAEERYEKIRILVDTIWRSRIQFFTKRNQLDKDVLTPFYLSAGMSLGELQIILSEHIDFIEHKREQAGELDEQEREEYETLVTEQESLKQLKADVDSITNLDSAIDKALEKLIDQINEAKGLETQAWNNFKEIAHLLNDTKARELYYMIEGAARNIKNISTYLEHSFLTHFDTLVRETKNHTKKVEARIQALKEKGVSFRTQAEKIAEQERLQAQEEEMAEQEEEEDRPKPKTGWFNWILSGFKKAFNVVISIIRLPYDMLFGKK
jgi:hypothetical protein